MGDFQYLEDEAIADIAFKATGNTLSDLFYQAGMATCKLQTELSKLENTKSETLEISKLDPERLLKAFLGEILYYKDADLFFVKDIFVKVFQRDLEWIAKCEFKGDTFDVSKHDMYNDLKAITYHNFYVKQLKNGKWECYVLVDI